MEYKKEQEMENLAWKMKVKLESNLRKKIQRVVRMKKNMINAILKKTSH